MRSLLSSQQNWDKERQSYECHGHKVIARNSSTNDHNDPGVLFAEEDSLCIFILFRKEVTRIVFHTLMNISFAISWWK